MKPAPKPQTLCCSRCATFQPFDAKHFALSKARRWGLDKICRDCRRKESRDKELKRRTGLTRDQLSAELDAGCWLCGGKATRRDVDPETREARGVVCTPCGAGVALLQHDPERLRQAAAHIEGHRLTWLCN
jgi:hypothetical protein